MGSIGLLLAGIVIVPVVSLGTYGVLAWIFRNDRPEGDAEG